MDKKDVAIMLGMVAEVYGKQAQGEPKVIIELWHRYLCDEPSDLVQQAFDEWIATEKWAPKPAEILEKIEKAKRHLYNETLALDFFDETIDIFDENDRIESVRKRQEQLPREYWPRNVTHQPKRYEIENQARIMRSIKGAEKIGLNEGGQE